MIDISWQKIIETQHIGRRQVVFFASTDSTNLQAAVLAKKGVPCGTVVLADTQSHGRGRLERVWQSPAGTGLYFSLIWHSQLKPEHLAKITLAAGLGLCKALAENTGLAPLIKWPNDLLLDAKKVGGILTENCGTLENKALIIIGVGLNVNTRQEAFSADLSEKASSLFISSQQEFSRGEMLAAALKNMEFELQRLEAGKILEVLTDFRKKDATLGRKMTWLTPARKMVTGVSLGIDAAGLLQVQDQNGVVHSVLSGDLNMAG
jgi:BirA family biotin operon repressor/biotin-[acetyl-CoA-carboxylase] ligase